MSDEKEFKLEEAFQALDDMLEQLESPEISLEESFQVYKEGMTLLARCNASIDQVEKKVLKLAQDGTLEEM